MPQLPFLRFCIVFIGSHKVDIFVLLEESLPPNSNLRIHSKIWAVSVGEKLLTMQHEAFQEVLPVHECSALSSWNGRHVIV